MAGRLLAQIRCTTGFDDAVADVDTDDSAGDCGADLCQFPLDHYQGSWTIMNNGRYIAGSTTQVLSPQEACFWLVQNNGSNGEDDFANDDDDDAADDDDDDNEDLYDDNGGTK